MRGIPVSVRDVPPHPDAYKIEATRWDGVAEGAHTGGAWVIGNEVWKALDGRPYANCDYQYQTQEAELLEVMAGRPLFPRNWRIEQAVGRSWLVRQRATVVEPTQLHRKALFRIEASVREANALGWEIGDVITLARDPETFELFILDLSCAHHLTGTGAFAADETSRILRLFEAASAFGLVELRRSARHLISPFAFLDRHPELSSADWREWRHVYASYYRPISKTWAARLPQDAVLEDVRDRTPDLPHTWIVTRQPMDPDVVRAYELEWGWSPIEHL